MKSLLLSLFFLFCFISLSSAQTPTLSSDFELRLGTPYKVLDASYTRFFFPTEEGKTLSIKRVKERMILQLLDTKNLKELKRVDYRELPPQNKYYVRAEYFLKTKNKLYLFSYYYDTKAKIRKMERRDINVRTLAVSSPKVLFTAPKRAYKSYINHSPDSSKILLGYSLAPTRKENFDGSSKEFLYVFDAENLSLLWKKIITIPHFYYKGKPTPAIPKVRTLKLYDNNSIKMLVITMTTDVFDVYTITKNEVDIKPKLIPLRPDKVAKLSEGNEKFFASSGATFFHDLSTKESNLIHMNGQGVLSYQFSSEGELRSTEDYKYPIDFITKYLTTKEKNVVLKEAKKQRAEIENLLPTSTLKKTNGGTLFISESMFAEQSVVNGQSTAITYNYKHLVLTSLKSDGTVGWVKKIPKNQFNQSNRSTPFYIGSQCFLSEDEKHAYIFYLDHPNNLVIAADAIPQEYRSRSMDGFLVLCKIDLEDGSYEKHLVADMGNIKNEEAIDIEIDNIFKPINTSNTFLMEVRMQKTDVLVEIIMKN